MSKSSTPPDPMEIRLRILRKVEINDDVDGLDIDSSGEEVRTDEVATNAVAEVVEDAVSVRLEHFGMAVETGITELGNFFREELDSIGGVAEDNRLVDLELPEGEEKGGSSVP